MHYLSMKHTSSEDRLNRLQTELRQLILMRETGPKRSAWHAARMRLIWRLHDQIARAIAEAGAAGGTPGDDSNGRER